MFKNVLAVIVTALACNTASAGFIQYNVDARFSDGATVEGFFVQDTDDNAIAYYRLFADGSDGAPATWYAPSGSFANILSARHNFYHGGPTSFTVFDDLSDAYYAELELSFRMGANGTIKVGGWEETSPVSYAEEYWGVTPSFRRITGGTVTLGEIDERLLASLLNGEEYVERIVPTPMPEPGSLALLAIGALGAASMRRRRQRAA